jgi:predicted PurR-regulated permease PerM
MPAGFYNNTEINFVRRYIMENGRNRLNFSRGMFFLTAFIALVFVGAVLKLTAQIVVLFTIAAFLACIMNPVVAFLERQRINRLVAIMLSGFLILAVIFLTGFILYSSGRAILKHYHIYEERLIEIYRFGGSFFDIPYDDDLSFLGNIWAHLEFRNNIRKFVMSFSNGFVIFLRNSLMVVLFVIFLLIESISLKKRIALAFENKLSVQIRNITSGIIKEITRYLSVKFFISLATGIVVGIALQIIGVEFAAVWAVIQFFLNFIPIIGSVAIGFFVMLFTLLQFWPAPGPVIAVGLVMLCSNVIIGNILEPRIMGYNLGISPIVILFSLMLWGWLWGFAGMILAVPMTVIIKIICENVPALEPVSILFGSGKELRTR